MRVLHWYPNFLSGGAVANSVLGLATAQARLGVGVSIVTAESSGNPLYGTLTDYLAGVELISWEPCWAVRRGNIVLRGFPFSARRRLAALSPDVVHLHGEFNPDNFWVSRLFKCPMVLSPHGAFHPAILLKGKQQVKRLYIAFAKRFLYKNFTFHSFSPLEEEHIKRALPQAQIYTVPQGPSLQMEKYFYDALECQNSCTNSFKFLFVGRLDVYTKGLDILLEALSQVVQYIDDKEIKLMLVGPDWNGGMSKLENQAKALGIEKHVSIMGTKVGKDLAGIFRQADIYIQPSRHDGFPLSVAEALLFGKPALLSREVGISSYPEISFLPRVLTFTLDIENLVNAMVHTIKTFSDLKMSAKESILKIQKFFSWDRIADLHFTAYQRYGHHGLK